MIKQRIKSLGYAIQGGVTFFKSETHAQIHLAATILVIGLGFYFEISKTDWIFSLLSIGLVIATEALNTAIEKLCDVVHPDKALAIKFVKDVSAFAVLIAAIVSLVIGLVIFVPHLLTIIR